MKKKVINVLRYLLFLFLVLVVVFPILFIFMSSFKTTEEIYGNPWAFPQRVRMDSYIAVFTEYGILRNLINSVIYSSITCIVTVIVSAMASYAIARMRWKLSKLLKPSIATIGIITFLNAWNDLMMGLIFLTKEKSKTIQLFISQFKGDHFTNYPILLSSIIISVIPMLIVYLLMSDRLVSGMTQGAIKG